MSWRVFEWKVRRVIPCGFLPLYAAVDATAKPLVWLWRKIYFAGDLAKGFGSARAGRGRGLARQGLGEASIGGGRDGGDRQPATARLSDAPRGLESRNTARERPTDRTCAFRAGSMACKSDICRCRMNFIFWMFWKPHSRIASESAPLRTPLGVKPGR
jgi:hypothetical protein